MPPDGTTPDAYVSRSDALHVCAVRESAREADFVASTDTIDRHHEVIDQGTWLLDAFKKNPVILYGHQSYELPIGQATRIEVVKNQLECTIRFATEEANPKAEQVWQLVKEKVLRAVSVGFRPKDGRYEIRDGDECFVYYNCELREISVVAIPANPDALSKMKSDARAKAIVERGELPFEVLGLADREAAREVLAKKTRSPDVLEALMAAFDHYLAAKTPAAPAASTPSEGGEETDMDLKEALAKIDALTVERTEAQQATKAANEKLAAHEATITTLQSEAKTSKDALTRVTEELTKTSTDRDAAVKRADEAEAKLIELEVDGLIGKKITPAEKADFIDMRKKMPDTFKSIVDKRPELNLTTAVTKNDTEVKQQGAPLNADPGTSLWNRL